MPNDPWFEEVDPLMELWMYESWCQDLHEKNEFEKAFTILGGSFVNPDMARAMMKAENPDYESSDEEFEKSIQMVLEDRKKKLAQKQQEVGKHTRRRRRRKRVITDNGN